MRSSAGAAPGSVLLLGGGARDAGFRRLLADACGVRMVWLPEAGGSAVGAALLAARRPRTHRER